MASIQVHRESLESGATRLSAGNCSFTFTRPKPKALLITIAGLDSGQFGLTTIDEIASALTREGELELFVDAREATGAAVSVSDEWTRFFVAQRDRLRRVHVLVGSKTVYLTIAIAQHLSRTGELIQIYSDAQIFESRLRKP